MQEKQVALVTGGGRGIGAAIAKRLAADGFFVVINYNGSEAAAESVAEEIRAAGGDAATYRCNVSEFAACEAMVTEIAARYGTPYVLVNNAGITRDALLMRMSEEDFDAVIATNLKGAFNCTKFVSKLMLKARAGRIINISSVSGVMGNAGQVNYAASKAGVIGLTKAAARELATRGITVNALAPGFIETDMTAVLGEKIRAGVTETIPMKRFGAAEDIAAAASFLCGAGAGYITGQVLAVDGGMSM